MVRHAAWRPASWFLLVLGLGLSGPGWADWKRDYDLGRRAIDEQRWAEAEQLMRAALREDGEPSARKRFQGARFDVYVPHFYAGLAAARRGDCAVAADLWQHAATREVVQRIAALAGDLRAAEAECSRRLAQTDAPRTDPATVPAQAVVPVAPTPGASDRGAAATPVASASPPPSRPPPEPRPATSPRPEPSPPTVRASQAPEALVALVEHYLAGRLDPVLAVDPRRMGDERAQAQAHLLRAAARHSRVLLDGGRLDSARDDIRIARQLDARLSPDDAVFSPRFRALWGETR